MIAKDFKGLIGIGCLAAVAMAATCLAQTAVVKELPLSGGLPKPTRTKYQEGHLIVIHREHTRTPGPADHAVAVVDTSGKQVFNRNPGFDVPDIGMINVRDATLTKNGHLVIAAYVWTNPDGGPGGASILMVYSLASGELVRVIRVNPVACALITSDPASNLWCFGPQVDERRAKQDYKLLHKFSLNGQLSGEYAPRSLFANEAHTGPQPYEPFQSSPQGLPQLLTTAAGRLVAWLPNPYEVVEWDLDGKLLTRTRLPEPPTGRLCSVTALADGTLISLLPAPGSEAMESIPSGLFRLNRSTGQWESLGAEWAMPYPPPSLVGADGSAVVLWDHAALRFIWLTVPE